MARLQLNGSSERTLIMIEQGREIEDVDEGTRCRCWRAEHTAEGLLNALKGENNNLRRFDEPMVRIADVVSAKLGREPVTTDISLLPDVDITPSRSLRTWSNYPFYGLGAVERNKALKLIDCHGDSVKWPGSKNFETSLGLCHHGFVILP